MTDSTYLSSLFQQFTKTRVLVIGDVMIDAYLWGRVDRISPEAPVPVVAVNTKENRLGGAANVALNLKALGATPFICAVSGNDENGRILRELLHAEQLSSEGIVSIENYPTTVKTRVISSGQQMLRIDEENTQDISLEQAKTVLAAIKELLENEGINAIILEDYNKGLLSEFLITEIILTAKQLQIPIAVDPKKKNFLSYKGVSLFKPNLKELKEGIKTEFEANDTLELSRAVLKLEQEIEAEITFITLSELGVYLKSTEFEGVIPAHKREIADVSGAGDTVISVAALCLALKTPHKILAALSNLAGGLVCEELGVVPVNKQKLLTEAIKLLAN